MTCDLDDRTPPNPIYRVGWEPDPWDLPDWLYASGDPPTFGHRFDDPNGKYRVLYAGSSYLACYAETLDQFREDPSLTSALAAISGVDDDDDVVPGGHVPTTWPNGRRVGVASVGGPGRCAVIGTLRSLTTLRAAKGVRAELRRHKITTLDAAVIRLTAPRSLTQRISRVVFDCRDGGVRQFAGLHYLSKHGDDLECWAIFENPSTGKAPVAVLSHESADLTTADACEALRILKLKTWDVAERRSIDP